MRAFLIAVTVLALSPPAALADSFGMKSPSGIDDMHHGPMNAAFSQGCARVIVTIPVWSGAHGAAFYYRFKRGDGTESPLKYWADNGPTGNTVASGANLTDEWKVVAKPGATLVVDDSFQVVGETYYPPNSSTKPFPPSEAQFMTISHVKTIRACLGSTLNQVPR